MKKHLKSPIAIFIYIALPLLLIGLSLNEYKRCRIKKNQRYYVAVPKKEIGKAKTYRSVVFADYKRINVALGYYDKEPKVGTRYLIVSDETNIKYQSYLFVSCPIPDSIKTPPDGWAKVPIPAFQKEVDAYFEGACNNIFTKIMFMDDEK